MPMPVAWAIAWLPKGQCCRVSRLRRMRALVRGRSCSDCATGHPIRSGGTRPVASSRWARRGCDAGCRGPLSGRAEQRLAEYLIGIYLELAPVDGMLQRQVEATDAPCCASSRPRSWSVRNRPAANSIVSIRHRLRSFVAIQIATIRPRVPATSRLDGLRTQIVRPAQMKGDDATPLPAGWPCPACSAPDVKELLQSLAMAHPPQRRSGGTTARRGAGGLRFPRAAHGRLFGAGPFRAPYRLRDLPEPAQTVALQRCPKYQVDDSDERRGGSARPASVLSKIELGGRVSRWKPGMCATSVPAALACRSTSPAIRS